MNFFHMPINLEKWNFFKKVKGPGHIETFRATNDMREGDLLVLYITGNKGVYGLAQVIREKYYLENAPDDYLNENYVVDAEIIFVRKDKPFIKSTPYKKMVNTLRGPNRIVEEENCVKIFKKIVENTEEKEKERLEEKKRKEEEEEERKKLEEKEKQIRRKEILEKEKAEISLGEEEISKYIEGGKYKTEVNVYKRSKEIRDKVVETHGTKCEICGFDFFEEYGEWGRNYIEVHHKNPISTWEDEKEVDIENDFICLCANCHKMIHRRRTKTLTPEELIRMRILKTYH